MITQRVNILKTHTIVTEGARTLTTDRNFSKPYKVWGLELANFVVTVNGTDYTDLEFTRNIVGNYFEAGDISLVDLPYYVKVGIPNGSKLQVELDYTSGVSGALKIAGEPMLVPFSQGDTVDVDFFTAQQMIHQGLAEANLNNDVTPVTLEVDVNVTGTYAQAIGVAATSGDVAAITEYTALIPVMQMGGLSYSITVPNCKKDTLNLRFVAMPAQGTPTIAVASAVNCTATFQSGNKTVGLTDIDWSAGAVTVNLTAN